MLGKYEFKIPEKQGDDDETILHIKVDTPNDKYLLDYMRLKIIDRNPEAEGQDSAPNDTETEKIVCINQMTMNNLKLKPNGDHGYFMILEGVMPYNSSEGQVVIDTLCNKEEFALQEVIQCEPVEYVDNYVPSKYGIIFKEKVVISPTDHTNATMNIRMMRNGEEFENIEGMKPKYFRVDILDNGKTIFSQTGYNQITISHFMFRNNSGLPDANEEGKTGEIKHNYVIQALFDLHEWPEGKTQNDESAEITW